MRKTVLVTSAWLCGVLLVGCSGPPPKTQSEPLRECSTREECKDGKICTVEGFCDDCASSGQCRLKEQCGVTTHRCGLRDGWGTECQLNDDCSAGQWCAQGLCKARGDVSLCPGGASLECPQGTRCNTINLVCEEDLGCSENADCGSGETCNSGSRACVPRCTVDTQDQVCAPGEKCVSEKCVQCESNAQCSVGLTCDVAGKCTAGARCYTDRDCKVPLVCHVATGACLTKQPPCVSDEDCGVNLRCEVGTGRCVPKTCQPDRYEPNEDRAHATPATPTRYLDLTLCSADVDTYALSLSRGDQLGVNVDADPFAEDTFSLRVEDTTGRTLSSGRFLTSWIASVTGTYYVSIRTSDLYQSYDVSFLLSRGTPCDDDSYEPNDTVATSTVVRSSTQLQGAICPQDADHFAVEVPPAHGLKATLKSYNSGAGLLRLCLFDGATELDCSDALDGPQVLADETLAAGKTLTVRVVGDTDRTANTYSLFLEYP
jgi:hypothetical protein